MVSPSRPGHVVLATVFILHFSSFLLVVNGRMLNRVCYLRPDRTFPVDEAIRRQLCTHIILGFWKIDEQARVFQDSLYTQFCHACRSSIVHHRLPTKLMFSIGGGGGGGFEMATSSKENRLKFIRSILEFIVTCDMDGVDIDWEFPAWNKRLSSLVERTNFLSLLSEIREQFDVFSVKFNKRLVLSTAVAAQVTIIHTSYVPAEMGKHVDFINLMTYDFYVYKWYWPFVGHNSALFARPIDAGITVSFNTEWSANYWHWLGVPKSKIVVGIPTYGKRFTLYSKHMTRPGSLAVGGREDSTYSYVCDLMRLNNTVKMFDSQARVPYVHHEHEWISYEDEHSAAIKARWIMHNHFGGAMTFSLNNDDYRQRCTAETLFPIHSAIRDTLGGGGAQWMCPRANTSRHPTNCSL